MSGVHASWSEYASAGDGAAVTTQQQTAGWDDQGQVDWYLRRTAQPSPRVAGERLLADLIPDGVRSVLDLGCGDGRLADLVMARAPSIERVVAVDRSEPMLAAARQRLAGRDGVTVLSRDLRAGIADLGRFDVVVSGLAIHHLADQRKRSLYQEIAGMLHPGGVFANLDIVTSASPARHTEFLRAIGRDVEDPEDRLAPLPAQLDWLREAGLAGVDCFWKWRGYALMGGNAPVAGSG
jgi:tRNA (cmo5U34)-methyltransferase